MSEMHPREKELARLSDGEAGEGIAEHVRGCARCRSVVADYRWLGGEIGATLAAAADVVPVPRPQWWAVQEHLCVSRPRVAGWRASALASIALVACLVLWAPNFLGRAVAAQISEPEVVMAPAPVTAAVSTAHLVSGATPTPIVSCGEATPSPTPAFVLPPTPPEPEI